MSLRKIRDAVIIFLVVILIGGGVYSLLEGWNFLDSLYFTVVTVTTLGYGDFVPQTTLGKIFTIFFSLSGIAIGLYILTVMGKYLFALETKQRGVKKIVIKRGKEFDVSHASIGELAMWIPDKKSPFEGIVCEIGLDYIKAHLAKKNGKLMAKKDQKIIKITSKGKLKNG